MGVAMNSVSQSPTHPLTHVLILTYALTHVRTYSRTHLLTYALTHALTHDLRTYLPTHLPTNLLTYLLTYLLTGGTIAWAQMGDPNASIPTPQPVVMRPMWGAQGKAVGQTSIAFVSGAAAAAGVKESYGLTKAVEPVKNTRNLGKKDMVHNDAMPIIAVDPETFEVTADGEKLTCEPAKSLPLAQTFFLF